MSLIVLIKETQIIDQGRHCLFRDFLLYGVAG